MANDNKMKKKKDESKEIVSLAGKFLPEEIVNSDGRTEIYSLEEEYAKTRKNKNWFVIFTVVGFIFFISLITYLIYNYSTDKDRNIEVNITEFDDLRLKEILNSTRITDNNIQLAKNDIIKLQVEMRNAILEVNNRYLQSQNALLDKGYSDAEVKSRLALLKKEEEAEVNSIKKKYDGLISEKRAYVSSVEQEKIKALRELEKQSKKFGKFSDENKVYEQKMKMLTESSQSGLALMANFYERYVRYIIQKYNPLFSSGEVKSALDRNMKRDEALNLKGYDDLYQKENIISKKRFDETRQKIYDQNILIQRLIGVGYENSVPVALRTIDNLSHSIVNDYETLVFSLLSTVKEKNSELEDYRIALDAVLKEKPESGYIISAKDTSKISVHINRLIPVHDGDEALVFRTDDLYIGKIILYRTSDGIKGKLDSLAGKEKLRPFDRILIKVK
ncbi:MAG TPA: hypothetical protein PKX79_00825 [Spirochaetota bacterium]|nr:hypothetical protein [Spirochaetota bacterium]HOK93641.1 hypothetical protein [Spirochaetota bacterium]HPP93904.1 hypothetical protein [Spirochaetota bacterium]